jgi:hypothetical protein
MTPNGFLLLGFDRLPPELAGYKRENTLPITNYLMIRRSPMLLRPLELSRQEGRFLSLYSPRVLRICMARFRS